MKSKHTDEQLNWLKMRLPEYENRAAAQVRGDAKGFALKCAEEYIEKWGLGTGPDAEKESQVKERIYTWFKNTSARGKEARRKFNQAKSERENSLANSPQGIAGSYAFAIQDPSDDGLKKQEDVLPFPENRHASLKTVQGSPVSPQQHPNMPPGMPATPSHGMAVMGASGGGQPPMMVYSPMQPPATPSAAHPGIPNLLQAFLNPNVPGGQLAQFVHQNTVNQVFPPTLTPVIQCLLTAANHLNTQNAENPSIAVDSIIDLMRRYKSMVPHLAMSISHFGCAGPQAGLKALRVALRKNSSWISYSATASAAAVMGSPSSPGSAQSTPRRPEAPISDQIARTSIDRYRRKEYLVWALIHSAAYEVGLLGPSKNSGELGLATEQDDDDGSAKLAENVAKDSLWETEESEWVAGALLLRAVIRRYTEDLTIDKNLHSPYKREWEELVAAYEARWKDVRDENRQQMMEDSINIMRKSLDTIH